MKAFITGISGFVGGYLCSLLHEEGFRVSGSKLGHEGLPPNLPEGTEIVDMDITDGEAVADRIRRARPDILFHLAAQSSVALSWKKPKLTFDVNVGGTLNLLDAIRDSAPQCKVLLIGSSEEYGKVRPEDMPLSEGCGIQPANPYAVSKLSQEMMGTVYASSYGLRITMVRAFNHTGPRQAPTFVISDFARRIAMIEKGLIPPVLKTGNLDAVRDFSDVRDIVRGYFMLGSLGSSGEKYNIGSGRGYPIGQLLDMLLSMSGTAIRIEADPERMRPSDVPVLICDNSKIKRETGWQPEIPMERTLRDVLDYWRNCDFSGRQSQH